MASKFLKTLSYFDFFGVSPNLYFKSGGKSKSWFGSLCSYLMIVYIILTILYSFADMVMRQNPKVVASVVKRDTTPISFGSNGFNLGVSFIDPLNGSLINDPSISTLEILSYSLKYDAESGNITGSEAKLVPYETCSPVHFNDMFSDTGFCI